MYQSRVKDIKTSGCVHTHRNKKNDYFAELQGRIQIDANDAYALLTQGNLNLRTYYKQTGLWQMFNTPIVRFVPILFNSSRCSSYS